MEDISDDGYEIVEMSASKDDAKLNQKIELGSEVPKGEYICCIDSIRVGDADMCQQHKKASKSDATNTVKNVLYESGKHNVM